MSEISSELFSFSAIGAWGDFSSLSSSKGNLSWPVVQKVLKLGAKVPGNHKVPFALRSLKLTSKEQMFSVWVQEQMGDSLLIKGPQSHV